MSEGVYHPEDARHAVQFYESDGFLIDEIARFAAAGMAAKEGVVLITTRRHTAKIEERLRGLGHDPDHARDAQGYLTLDAEATLTRLVRGGNPDLLRLREVAGSAIRTAALPGRRVRVFGEMVALLWEQGQREAAIRLEAVWNDLARELPFRLLCAYPLGGFAGEGGESSLHAVCDEHAEVRPAESYSAVRGTLPRLRTITELQRRARVLEAEVARRQQAEQVLRERHEALAASEAGRRAVLEQLLAANRAKDEFLAMLGHELRNPLSVVRNAVVSARIGPERRERALEIASRGADQLARLVDDLLDVARINEGRITLRMRRMPFSALLVRAVEAARSFVEERAHRLALALPEEELVVEGDAERLEQALGNLLHNAAKYTPQGGRIEVALEREGDDAVVRVSDDGIGIAPEMLGLVFDLFAQAHRNLDRAEGGLGIGLTVVRRLVELHGGRVEARSAGPGRGSEFVLRIPTAPLQAAAPDDPPRSPAPRICARVLVVEDHPDAAESLEMLLGALGHQVVVRYDGPSALDAAAAEPPDVMLVDVGMPGMDGYEVARRVRLDPRLRRVRLVALTGYGSEDDRRRSRDAGFDHHLVKPVEPDSLARVVAELAAVSKSEGP